MDTKYKVEITDTANGYIAEAHTMDIKDSNIHMQYQTKRYVYNSFNVLLSDVICTSRHYFGSKNSGLRPSKITITMER